jgi:hypothetical protein
MSSIKSLLVPTGGAISFSIVSSGTTTFSRAVSGVGGLGSFTQLYSGGPIQTYVDTGDMLPAPLDPTQLYVYQMVDANGTLTTPPIQPYVALNLQQEPLLALLIRLLQAGVTNLITPTGVQPCQVLQAMPLVGFPPMPFMVVNMDLMQQAEIPIGQSAEAVDMNGNWTMTGFARRVFRISVLAQNTTDRDFYRDASIGIFESIIKSVLTPLGLDVRHRYQAAAGQVANDNMGQSPGFYYADVMCTFEGTFNILITPQYGLMNTITFTGTQASDGKTVISTTATA